MDQTPQNPPAQAPKVVNDLMKKLSPCCACKPTKSMRDECIRSFGEEKCLDFVRAHEDCLREKGFKVVSNNSVAKA